MTLKGHYALCFKTRASFGAHHKNLNEGRLDSGNIRIMRIFAGVLWKGSVIQQWGNRKRVFRAFGCYVFGTLGNEANISII